MIDSLAYVLIFLAAAVCLAVIAAFYVAVFWLVWAHPLWLVFSVVWLFCVSWAAGRLFDRRERRLRLVREVMDS